VDLIDAAIDTLDARADGPIADIQVFAKTAPAEGEGEPAVHYTNPQTTAFCAMLGIADLTNPAPAPPRTPPGQQNGRVRGNGRGRGHGHQNGTNGDRARVSYIPAYSSLGDHSSGW
jgi:lariat debranching enzyme